MTTYFVLSYVFHFHAFILRCLLAGKKQDGETEANALCCEDRHPDTAFYLNASPDQSLKVG
jgi:hypothetical protein